MTKTVILIGNLLSLCAMISDSVSGTRKDRNDILKIQIISQFFYGATSTVLKGYSSTVQNAIAVFRNLAAMKNVKSKAVEYLLILAGVGLGILFNNRGVFGWLPILANLEYSVAIFRFKDNESILKLAFILNAILFAIFNAIILNYVGVLSCVVIAVTTTSSLLRERREEENNESNDHPL